MLSGTFTLICISAIKRIFVILIFKSQSAAPQKKMVATLSSPDLSESKECCECAKLKQGAALRGLVLPYTTWHSFTGGDVLSPVRRSSSFWRQCLRFLISCHMFCFSVLDADNSVFLT